VPFDATGPITRMPIHKRGHQAERRSEWDRRIPARRWTASSLLAVPSLIVAAGLIASAGSRAADSSPAASYLPSLSDLMIATIQPRHERLWQAAQQHNWEFAAYELHNLHGAFDRVGHAHPTVENTSLPDMIASVTDQPFVELKSAIEAKGDAAFAKAYANLTDACNSCHQALNHGTVVIGVPDGASSSDLKAVTSRRP
jgi:hypothetical protein